MSNLIASASNFDYSRIRSERLERMQHDVVLNANAPPIAHVDDFLLSSTKCRLYRDHSSLNQPLLVYLHGGGWMFGSIESHDKFLRQLAKYFGIFILSIDYPLSPEHPFPAARDSVINVLKAVSNGGLGELIDPQRIALAGDSAGANIALSAALKAKVSAIKCLILFYGAFKLDCSSDSHRRFGGDQAGFSTSKLKRYWSHYLFDCKQLERQEADLLNADFAHIPPAYILAAGKDPLLDDSILLRKKFETENIINTFEFVKDKCHGFLRLNNDINFLIEIINPVIKFMKFHI